VQKETIVKLFVDYLIELCLVRCKILCEDNMWR